MEARYSKNGAGVAINYFAQIYVPVSVNVNTGGRAENNLQFIPGQRAERIL